MTIATAPDFTDLEAFLDDVLLDGRFIDDFHRRPVEVGRALGRELAPETVEALLAMEPETALEQLYRARFNEKTTPQHPYVTSVGFVAAAIGVIAAAILVAEAVVVMVTGAEEAAPLGDGAGGESAGVAPSVWLEDRSPERESKL